MGKQLVLVLALVITLSAVAVISYAVGDRSNAVTNIPETAALSGAEAEDIAPLADQADSPGEFAPELVSTDAVTDQPSGSGEGIKVHGSWMIEVTEPDGTFVSLTEFDNSLTFGAAHISRVLAGNSIPGRWMIVLDSDRRAGTRPCHNIDIQEASCSVSEHPLSHPSVLLNPSLFGGLEVTSPSSGTNADSLALNGTVTALRNGNISLVRTMLFECSSNVPPVERLGCVETPSFLDFSEKTLGSAVPVLENQAVNVTVVFSFS